MSPDRVYQVTDPESNLECRLTILRGADCGASAVVVELSNPSTDYDVVLKVNTEQSAFIMLTVADQKGTVLSKPARLFDSSEIQQFEILRIRRGSSHRWRVPIAAQLEANVISPQGLSGRLVVNVALLFSKVVNDEQPADVDYQQSLLTLYDMDLLFTRSTLAEDVKPADDDS